MDDLAGLSHKQHRLICVGNERRDHIIAGGQLDVVLRAVRKLVYIQAKQLAFKGNKAKEVLFQGEADIKWLIHFLQHTLAQIMIAKNRLGHRCHGFLYAAATADLEEEFSQW